MVKLSAASKRTALIVAACASPIVLLGGAWLLLTEVLLAPAPPGENSSGAQVVEYVTSDKGLPRLPRDKVEPLFEAQSMRMARDAQFRNEFLSAYRSSSPEERDAFRRHLFDVWKPIVMRDVAAFHALPEDARRPFLDEEYVDMKRIELLWSGIRVEKTAADAVDLQRTQEMIMSRIAPDELNATMDYLKALARRAAEIEADPELKARMEQMAREPKRR